MVARTMEMKGAPAVKPGLLERLCGRRYRGDCEINRYQVSRFVGYRATFIRHQTTSLMPTPYQSSPGVPLTEQLAEDRRSSRPVVRLNPNLDFLLLQGESRPNTELLAAPKRLASVNEEEQ